jgi:hypothetical protein
LPISAKTEITDKIPHIFDSIFVECKDLEIVNKIDEIILDELAISRKNKSSCSPLKVSVNKKLINKNEIVSILISNSSDTNIHFSAVLNILSSGKNFEDVYISIHYGCQFYILENIKKSTERVINETKEPNEKERPIIEE